MENCDIVEEMNMSCEPVPVNAAGCNNNNVQSEKKDAPDEEKPANVAVNMVSASILDSIVEWQEEAERSTQLTVAKTFNQDKERKTDKENGPPKLQLLETDDDVQTAKVIVANAVASARVEGMQNIATSVPALMTNVTDINNNQICLKEEKEIKSDVLNDGSTLIPLLDKPVAAAPCPATNTVEICSESSLEKPLLSVVNANSLSAVSPDENKKLSSACPVLNQDTPVDEIDKTNISPVCEGLNEITMVDKEPPPACEASKNENFDSDLSKTESIDNPCLDAPCAPCPPALCSNTSSPGEDGAKALGGGALAQAICDSLSSLPSETASTSLLSFYIPSPEQTRACGQSYISYNLCIKRPNAKCQDLLEARNKFCPSDWIDFWNKVKEPSGHPL